jgi:glucose/arabinose dehydrogenase
VALFAIATPLQAYLPVGFGDRLVATLPTPTALDFTPDGRMLVASKGGAVNVLPPEGSPALALTLPAGSLCSDAERGLLGLAVSPGFAVNHHFFLFYTFNAAGTCVQRVSRFTLSDAGGVDAASELVLIDNIPSPSGTRIGGDLQFGRDGYLYVAVGDGGCDYAGGGCGAAGAANDAARDEHTLLGKVLRLAEDGSIPAGNPFQGPGTARCQATGGTTPGNRCQETFAWGLHDPVSLAFDPNATGTRFYVLESGHEGWEEINLGAAGADYGWNCREGSHPLSTSGPCNPAPAGMVDPAILEYPHGTPLAGMNPTFESCGRMKAGVFVPNGTWPGYDDAFLFEDVACNGTFRLDPGGNATSLAQWDPFNIPKSRLKFGPYGPRRALYYTTPYDGGAVRRILGPPGASDFYTVTPCRLVDTRGYGAVFGGPAMDSIRQWRVAGHCGIPFAATALAVNLTITGPLAGGFLSLLDDPFVLSNTSTINFSGGQTIANNAIAKLSLDGDLIAWCRMDSAGYAHLIVDVVGYYQ